MSFNDFQLWRPGRVLVEDRLIGVGGRQHHICGTSQSLPSTTSGIEPAGHLTGLQKELPVTPVGIAVRVLGGREKGSDRLLRHKFRLLINRPPECSQRNAAPQDLLTCRRVYGDSRVRIVQKLGKLTAGHIVNSVPDAISSGAFHRVTAQGLSVVFQRVFFDDQPVMGWCALREAFDHVIQEFTHARIPGMCLD